MAVMTTEYCAHGPGARPVHVTEDMPMIYPKNRVTAETNASGCS